MDYNPPGSPVHGISQAKKLEWVAISFSRGSSRPWDGTCVFCVSCLDRRVLYHHATWDSQRSCIMLRSQQQCMRVPVSPHPHQHLLSSDPDSSHPSGCDAVLICFPDANDVELLFMCLSALCILYLSNVSQILRLVLTLAACPFIITL